VPPAGAARRPCTPAFDSDPGHCLAIVVENVEHAPLYLDFHLWKEPTHVNDGLQTVP
jgi:hypothetical protein